MKIELTTSRVVAAAPEAVWAVVSDYPRDPLWRTGVTVMEASGPLGPGITTHEVMRLGGRTYVNDAVIDSVTPGRHLTWHTTEGADASGARTVERTADGTARVTLEVVAHLHGLERALGPVLKRLLARNLRRDLDRLAAVVAAEEGARRTPV